MAAAARAALTALLAQAPSPALPSLSALQDSASLWTLLPHLVPPHTVAALRPSQHAALDELVAVLRARNVLAPWTFYSRGFGRVRRGCVDVARELRATAAALQRCPAASPLAPPGGAGARIELAPSPAGRPYAHVAEGRFPAPPELLGALPLASHTARFQLVTPTAWLESKTPTRRPVVVLLPGTGEHGFVRRRHLLAYPLAQAGIGSVILEGPFYGSRKCPEQFGSKLLALANLTVLGRATIQEAVGLVAWLRSRTPEEVEHAVRTLPQAPHPPLAPLAPAAPAPPHAAAPPGALPCQWRAAPAHAPGSAGGAHAAVLLTGVSMGGLHAAMSAAMLPRAWGGGAGCLSWLGPPSGAGVFTRGALARACDWRALVAQSSADACEDAVPGGGGGAGHGQGGLAAALAELQGLLRADVPQSAPPSGEHAARLAAHWPGLPAEALQGAMAQVSALLRLTDVAQFPAPARPDAGRFVVAAHDRYVPLEASERAQWAWVREGWSCAVDSVSAGHVSGSILQSQEYVAALQRGVARL